MAGLTAPGRNGEFFRFLAWSGVVSLVLRVSPFYRSGVWAQELCKMMDILPFSFAS